MKKFKIVLLVLGICCLSLFSACSKKSEDKVFKVAMEASYAPYNWTQSGKDNGAVKISGSNDYANGYDVMVAKKIASEIGYELEIVKLDWDSLIPAVQSGTVSAAIAGQSITEKRKTIVDFSKPYYYASVVTLVKKDNKYANAKSLDDLKGAVATSQLNTVWYDVCIPQIEDVKILPAKESAPAALVALNSGEIDIVVTDMPTAKAALVAYSDFELLDFSSSAKDYEVSTEEVEIGISVKKGNKDLLDKINSVLEKMTQEDFNKLMEEAIKVQPLSN